MSWVLVKIISGIIFVVIPGFALKENMKKHPILNVLSLVVGCVLLALSIMPIIKPDLDKKEYATTTDFAKFKTDLKNLIISSKDTTIEKQVGKKGVRVTFLEEKISPCDGEVNENLYIKGDSLGRFEANVFTNSTTVAIARKRSNVKIWRSDKSLLSNCETENDWRRVSGIAPANTSVLALGANCQFNKPKNKNNRFLQFTYFTGIGDISKNGGMFYPTTKLFGYYETIKDYAMGNVKNIKLEKVGVVNARVDEGICKNIELNYCGDGIIQSDYEECDGGDTCSSICKAI